MKHEEKKLFIFENNRQEEQQEDSSHSVLLWILASILLHLLIVLICLTYKFQGINMAQRVLKPEQQYTPYILMQDPKQQLPQSPQPAAKQAPPKSQPKPPVEEKKEEEKMNAFDPAKMPLIIPGKAGIDHQDLDGLLSDKQNAPQAKQENPTAKQPSIVINEKTPPKKQEKMSPPSALDDGYEDETVPQEQQESDQQDEQQAQQPAEVLPLPSNNKASSKSQLIFSPEKASFLAQTKQATSSRKQKKRAAQPDADYYPDVPEKKLQQEVKTMSFKDLGFGHSSVAPTMGNSANLGINGLSPDIPTGEQLRYVTYLNKMSKMLQESYIYTLHVNHLMNKKALASEKVTISMTIDRSGKLLDCKVIQPNKNPQLNQFVLDVIKNVGLFDKLPSFYQGDTFRQIWTICLFW